MAGPGERADRAVADDDLAVGVGGDPGVVVTRTTVAPCSRAAATSRSITSSPDTESSAPVGSSANSTSGPATSPRASATRCACPPDSSPDLRPLKPVQAERRKPLPGRRHRRAAAGTGQQQRQRHVLLGGQFGHELTGLEHEPNTVPAQRAAPLVAEGVKPLPFEPDLAAVRDQDARQAVQQG